MVEWSAVRSASSCANPPIRHFIVITDYIGSVVGVVIGDALTRPIGTCWIDDSGCCQLLRCWWIGGDANGGIAEGYEKQFSVLIITFLFEGMQ
jgi:hypothetical protein